jgi:hypothetical protein
MGNIFIISPASGGVNIALLADVMTAIGLGTGGDSPTDKETAIITEAWKQAEGAIIRHLRYNPVLSQKIEYYPNTDYTSSSMGGVWESEGNEAFFRRFAESVSDELQIRGLPVRETDQSGNNPIDLRIDYDGRSGTRVGAFATADIEGTDFWPNYDGIDSASIKICSDGIIRSEGRWPSVAGSVQITYMSGYTAEELAGIDSVIDASPIREAVIDEAVRRTHKAFSRMKKRTGFGAGPLSSESLGDYSYSVDGVILQQLVGSKSDVMAETALKLESFVNFGALIGT